jgi:F-type H+-transporting ATPase subunit b
MRKQLFITLAVMLLSSLPAVASEETPNGWQENIFSGSFADALWTVITFFLLLVVLLKFAWKPILDGLKARQEHIEQEIKSAEDARKQAEDTLQDYKQRGLRIIEDATAAAQQSQRELIDETRKETQLIKTRAQDDIRHAMTAASDRLWNEASEMLLILGNEVLGRSLTPQDNERLIREAVEKMKTVRTNTAK